MTRRKKPINKTITKTLNDPSFKDVQKVDLPSSDKVWEGFKFPDDLDRIQPEQKDGSLCIRFPE